MRFEFSKDKGPFLRRARNTIGGVVLVYLLLLGCSMIWPPRPDAFMKFVWQRLHLISETPTGTPQPDPGKESEEGRGPALVHRPESRPVPHQDLQPVRAPIPEQE